LETASGDRVLDYYESIGRLAHSMADAARASDWEALADAEQRCAELIEELRACGDAEAALSPRGRVRRMEILRSILADDAEIRRHTEPALVSLDKFLLRSGGRRRMHD
jgi:flagellar protein FliT